MLDVGIAMSHAPSMFSPVDTWDTIYDALKGEVPPPPHFIEETADRLISYRRRIDVALETLRAILLERLPDVVVIVGDDQAEVFGPEVIPSLAIFAGERAAGTVSIASRGEDPRDNHISLTTDVDVAEALAADLTYRGFNPAVMRALRPAGRPDGGLGHAFTRPAHVLGIAECGLPVVAVFVNAYHPPLPNGQHLYNLGRAIGDFAERRPEKVALVASGGLSHDPLGPRAGWIDEKLDRWVLDAVAAGDPRRLTSLFTFESEMLDGGTGEIRSWIAVAAAFEPAKGRVVDYIPIIRAVTGLGFAYWTR